MNELKNNYPRFTYFSFIIEHEFGVKYEKIYYDKSEEAYKCKQEGKLLFSFNSWEFFSLITKRDRLGYENICKAYIEIYDFLIFNGAVLIKPERVYPEKPKPEIYQDSRRESIIGGGVINRRRSGLSRHYGDDSDNFDDYYNSNDSDYFDDADDD